MKNVVLKVNPSDNVIVALKDLSKGDTVAINGEQYEIQEAIPSKHKFFTTDLRSGDPVVMYGVLVGKAQSDIIKGSRMTTTNVKHAAQPYDYRGSDFQWR